MREALRNIWRRKSRSLLTIMGVAIGVFALTTMGSLALYFNNSLNNTLDYYSSRVTVSSAGAGFGGGSFGAMGEQVPADLANRIKVIDGVETAYPTITILASDSDEQVGGFREPEMVYGYDPADLDKDPKKLKVASGRALQAGDSKKVVIGSSIASSKKLKVGDTATIRNQKFEVVGILERTNGSFDSLYLIPLADAQPMIAEQNPFRIDSSSLVTDIQVIPRSGVSGDELARRIKQTISGVSATPPETFKKQVQQSFQVFNLIVLGSALIALLVGGLSVINTMIMSVAERRKEIGVKQVVGARPRHILKEVVLETATMALIGGIIGCALGGILTTVINNNLADQGLQIFSFTADLVIGSLLFAVVLGIIAGLYPAWRASRVKPVNVLREE